MPMSRSRTVDDADGRAIVGLDPATGALRWRQPIPETDGALLMTDSVIVVSTESIPERFTPPTIEPTGTLPPDGSLTTLFYRGLDRSSGSEKWHVAVTVTTGAGGYQGGSVDGDTVILDPAMVALDARSGDELWRMTDQPGNSDPAFGPAADGVIVSGGQGSPTSGVDTSSGAVLWTQPGWPPYSDVWAVGDGAVYVVDMTTSEMVAYELSDGSHGGGSNSTTTGTPGHGSQLATPCSRSGPISTPSAPTTAPPAGQPTTPSPSPHA